MPPPPLIRSERQRDRVIAAVMLCVLLGSLGAAYGLTRRHAAQPVATMDVTIHDLTFQLPQTWEKVVPEDPEGNPALQLVDSSRPTRTLTLLRMQTPGPVPGEALLLPVMERLIQSRAGGPAQTVSAETARRGDLIVTEWVGISPPPQDAAGQASVHLAANLTGNGRIHWLLYLNDQAAADEHPQAVLRGNLGLLRSIVHSTVITAPPESPETPKTPETRDAPDIPDASAAPEAAKPADPQAPRQR